jgi:radical SAM superfamily enzyme YgiQ (UPF0313 family)
VKAKYPLEFVVFVDDVFVLSESWLVEFAEKYPREVGLPFFCNTRANLVTAEQVQFLKKAGCTSVSMGIETADDRIRNELLKRKMSKGNRSGGGPLANFKQISNVPLTLL